MEKPYLAFGGDTYYPSGGWGDFKGAYETWEEADARVAKYDWGEVIDIRTIDDDGYD